MVSSRPRLPILVVEDDPGTREALVRLLALRGWPTVTAPAAERAIAYLERGGEASRVILEVGSADAGRAAAWADRLHDAGRGRIPLVAHAAEWPGDLPPQHGGRPQDGPRGAPVPRRRPARALEETACGVCGPPQRPPCRGAVSTPAVHRRKESAMHRRRTGGGVLVVDDEPDVRDALIALLESDGYEAIGAANGAEALRLLREDGLKPCLILLDLMMPVKDGWQFRAEQLADPALAGIPTVIVSAAAGRDESFVAEKLQAVAALRKPIDLERLAEIVGTHCCG